MNILALWASSHRNGYGSGIWGTYRQWAEAGAQVRKGEKSSHIVFYKEFQLAGETHDDAETRMVARASSVFAAEQVDGYALPVVSKSHPMDLIASAEAFVTATGASVAHGGTQAYYRPSTDSIQLPPRDAFVGTETINPSESYYSTLLHELTHWTSHASRCDRQLGRRFGDNAYAMEELVAELGAAFLCAELGITTQPRPDHAQYLNSWLTVLKADKKAVFTAASKASQATAWLQVKARSSA